MAETPQRRAPSGRIAVTNRRQFGRFGGVLLSMTVALSVLIPLTLVTATQAGASSGPSWATAPAPPSGNDATAVSCPSTSFCMGVWGQDSSSPSEIATWDEQLTDAWKTTDLPVSLDDGFVIDLSCVNQTNCVVVGNLPTPPGSETAFAAQWNGTSWSELDQPSFLTANESELDSVSCVSTAFCMAVGRVFADGNWQPATEEWNGSSVPLLLAGPTGWLEEMSHVQHRPSVQR